MFNLQSRPVNLFLFRNLSTVCYIWQKRYGWIWWCFKRKHEEIHANLKWLLPLNFEIFLCFRSKCTLSSSMENSEYFYFEKNIIKNKFVGRARKDQVIYWLEKFTRWVWRATKNLRSWKNRLIMHISITNNDINIYSFDPVLFNPFSWIIFRFGFSSKAYNSCIFR